MKKTVIREGDQIRIIKPEFVSAWGYDNNYKDTLEELRQDEELQAKIHQFLETVVDFNLNWAVDKTLQGLAYDKVKANFKSGAIKSLKKYVLTCPSYAPGTIHTVTEKKIVKTGKYSAPSYSSSYWEDDYDYEPGYLSNEKTHILLNIDCFDKRWIEAINVEKLR